MSLSGQAQQIWVYLGENDRVGLQQTATVLLDFLREQRISGVTVLRGVAGFGSASLARSDEQMALSRDLPMIITFVDSPEQVARVMPRVQSLVRHGMITRQTVDVLKYTRAMPGSFSASLSVASVMSRQVVAIMPDAAIDHIVTLLINRALRSLPVIDGEGRLQGIITDGDLLQRGGVLLPIPGQALAVGQEPPRQQYARDLMTPNPAWVLESSPLAEAAALLVTRDLKRLPVLNEQGKLVGMVSRSDLLGSVVGNRPAEEQMPTPPNAQARQVAEVMIRAVPTVGPTSMLPEVLDALLQAQQRRVVVIDAERRVLGIISDGDVMRRAARHVPASSARGLWGWLRGGPRPASFELAGSQVRAQDIMTSPVTTITADAPIRTATEILLSLKVKRLPVVDAEGHLVGLVGRAGLLQALTSSDSGEN